MHFTAPEWQALLRFRLGAPFAGVGVFALCGGDHWGMGSFRAQTSEDAHSPPEHAPGCSVKDVAAGIWGRLFATAAKGCRTMLVRAFGLGEAGSLS